MPTRPAGRPGRWDRSDWWPLVGTALAVAGVTTAARAGATVMSSGTTQVLSAMWPTHAVILSILLIAPRRLVAAHAVVGVATLTATVLVIGTSWPVVLIGHPLSATLVISLALLLRRDGAWVRGRTDTTRSWLRYLGAVLLGLALNAAPQALIRQPALGGPEGRALFWDFAATHFATNAVAFTIIVPAVLRLRPRVLRDRIPAGSRRWFAGIGLVSTVVSVGCMLQGNPLFLVVVAVPLIFGSARYGICGLTWCATASLPALLGFTQAGVGPFVELAGGDPAIGLLWAQFTLVLLMACGLTAISAATGSQRDPDDLSRLLDDRVHDFACLIDHNGHIVESVPAARGVLQHHWQEFADPEDIAELSRAMTAAAAGETVTYSGWTPGRHGNWHWVETSMRRARHRNHADRVVVVVGRDVTEDRLRGLTTLQRRTAQLDEAAHTDPLTGLANRRGLEREHARCRRAAATTAQPLSLLMIDIDYFKLYNDSLGHQQGDEALRSVAAVIREFAVVPGVAARYGGEEFVVLLPGADSDETLAIAEALIERVRSMGLEHPRSPLGLVTVSVGIGTERPEVGSQDDGRLLAAADSALYRAKSTGRSRAETGPAEQR